MFNDKWLLKDQKVMYHINKIQKYNFTLKAKQGRDDQIIISKGPFFLNMFPKNKQYYKLRQTKKNEIKEEIYLNYTTIIYAYFFLLLFLSDKLAEHT